MVSLFKALFPGFLLTWIVAGIIGSNGSKGGFLYIFQAHYHQYSMYWSWPLFLAATGLAFAIFKMME